MLYKGIVKNLTFFLILFSSTLFGQIPENILSFEDKAFNDYFFNVKHIPTVKGKILNLTAADLDSLTITYSIVTPLEQGQIEKSTELSADGTFELELDFAFPYQQIWLSVGELYYAGIYANTDLQIELDADILKSEGGVNFNGPGIKYHGADGLLNAYLNDHVLFKRKEQLNLSRSIRALKRKRNLDAEEFLAKYDSIYAIIKELDDEFIGQNPSDFSWIIKNERQSDYYRILNVWHWGKEMKPALFEKVNQHKPYLTSNEAMQFYYTFFTYLKNRPQLAYVMDYSDFKGYSILDQAGKSLLDSLIYFQNKHSKNLAYDTLKFKSFEKEARQLLHDTVTIEKTVQLLSVLERLFDAPKADFLKMKITSKDPAEQKQLLELALNGMQTEWCKQIIQAQYEENLNKLATINKVLAQSKALNSKHHLGQPIAEMPFGAKLYKVDSLEAQALLSNLKRSFENKALLIDFWATWCRPCLAEMPHSKTLSQEAKDLPIEFVYLCTSSSSNVEKWKSKIAEYELGGTHIFVERGIESELMDLFSVSGFPSYVFINTKGEYKPGAVKRVSRLDKNKLVELME